MTKIPKSTAEAVLRREPAATLPLAELIEGVSHELNNNIAIALGHVQLLKLKIKDETVIEGLNRIEKSMFKCGNIVKAIQEHTGRPNINLESAVRLCDALSAALEFDETNWKEAASKKNVTINSSALTKNCFVLAAHDDLVSAISQLLHNAVDASPRNGTIEISITAQAELVTLTIADQGKGISEVIKPKIYEAFFSTKKTKGAGLGLTIVQSIVARYGGRIGFTANQPTGTTFNISFPVVEQVSWPEDSKAKAVKISERKILIVDDDEEVRNVLKDMLSIEGFQAENCSDAFCAMELLEKSTFNMMITDLGMPGMSGYDLAEYVHDKYKEIEIVLLTGWGNSIKNEGRKLKGVRAVISKPFRLNQILELVRN